MLFRYSWNSIFYQFIFSSFKTYYMAKQVSLFEFSGRLGDVVGYRYKDKFYIRRRPVQRKGTFSMAQQIHLEKFRTVTKFVRSLTPLLRTCYTNFHGNMSAGNHLTKDIFK